MGIQERKARERKRRYNEILDAAELLFFKKGFNQVTMDDIAREAELAKGTLYLYFNSREDLHYGIVIRGLEVLNRIMREEYRPQASALENIRNMGDAYVRFFREYPNYFRAIIYFDASHVEKVEPTRKMKILEKESPLVFFIELVKKGQEEGSVACDIPAATLAIILWSQVSGVFEFIAFRHKILEVLDIDPGSLIHHQFNVLSNGLQKTT